jgi:hypothetical protein
MYAESVHTQLNVIQYNTAVYFKLEAKIPVMNDMVDSEMLILLQRHIVCYRLAAVLVGRIYFKNTV